MELGKFGVFSYLDTLSAGEVAGFARKLEHLGYSALWFPETFGRDPFVCAAHVLGNTAAADRGRGGRGGMETRGGGDGGGGAHAGRDVPRAVYPRDGRKRRPVHETPRAQLPETAQLHARVPHPDARGAVLRSAPRCRAADDPRGASGRGCSNWRWARRWARSRR